MEGLERSPGEPRIEEIDESYERSGLLGPEVAAREPEDGKSAERAGRDLHRGEGKRGRRQDPEGSEQCQDRVDVARQAERLLARRESHLEWPSVSSARDCLHHVAEVEARKLERVVRGLHRDEERDRPTEHRSPEEERPAAS